jgi:hypothetical protein
MIGLVKLRFIYNISSKIRKYYFQEKKNKCMS